MAHFCFYFCSLFRNTHGRLFLFSCITVTLTKVKKKKEIFLFLLHLLQLNIEITFLFYLLFQTKVLALCQKSVVPQLNLNHVKNLRLPLVMDVSIFIALIYINDYFELM